MIENNSQSKTMIIKTFVEEDFTNYKVPSLVIGFPKCDFKCGKRLCQNNVLSKSPDKLISISFLLKKYIENPITKAICLMGLEPFDTWEDVKKVVKEFREVTNDDIVIYTGYNRCEVNDKVTWLKKYKNIIIKYGRFVPDQKSHYDDILGVDLASDNQYAEKIS